jgi:hypothetical protein
MNPRDAKRMIRRYLIEKAFISGRSFNRISHIPVLKK